MIPGDLIVSIMLPHNYCVGSPPLIIPKIEYEIKLKNNITPESIIVFLTDLEILDCLIK